MIPQVVYPVQSNSKFVLVLQYCEYVCSRSFIAFGLDWLQRRNMTAWVKVLQKRGGEKRVKPSDQETGGSPYWLHWGSALKTPSNNHGKTALNSEVHTPRLFALEERADMISS